MVLKEKTLKKINSTQRSYPGFKSLGLSYCPCHPFASKVTGRKKKLLPSPWRDTRRDGTVSASVFLLASVPSSEEKSSSVTANTYRTPANSYHCTAIPPTGLNLVNRGFTANIRYTDTCKFDVAVSSQKAPEVPLWLHCFLFFFWELKGFAFIHMCCCINSDRLAKQKQKSSFKRQITYLIWHYQTAQ